VIVGTNEDAESVGVVGIVGVAGVAVGELVGGGVSPPYVQTPSVPSGICECSGQSYS
jgi:hypothetical protein